MAIPIILGAIGAISTIISGIGQVTGAAEKAEAAKQNAALKDLQANELLARQAINEQIMRDQSEKTQDAYASAFASTGREGGGISGVLQIMRDTEQNISLSRREATFKAQILRTGAEQDMKLSSDIMTAGFLSGAGTLLTGAGTAYDRIDRYKAPGEPKNLPGVPK